MRRCSLWVGLIATGSAAVAQAASFEQNVAADPHGVVDVSNVAGTIDVKGWDKPQVSVTADLGSSSEKVEVTNERGHVNIRVTGQGRGGLFGFLGSSEAKLQVWVPRTSELNASAVSADINSKGMLGAQQLHSVSGDIRADVSGADNDIKTVSGDVKLQGNGQPGHFRINSVSGDLSLERAAGDIDAMSVSGDVEAELSPATNVHLHTTSGDISLTGRLGPSATVEAQTVSGDVNLHSTAQNGFEYEVRSFSGDIGNCFGKEAERNSEYGPGKHLIGTLGQGGAKVRVNTLSGDVRLCDH